MPELREPLEATEAVSLLPVSTPLSTELELPCKDNFCLEGEFDMSDSWLSKLDLRRPESRSDLHGELLAVEAAEDRLRTRSNFSLRSAMKCFISGKYSVILPCLVGVNELLSTLATFLLIAASMRPQSL